MEPQLPFSGRSRCCSCCQQQERQDVEAASAAVSVAVAIHRRRWRRRRTHSSPAQNRHTQLRRSSTVGVAALVASAAGSAAAEAISSSRSRHITPSAAVAAGACPLRRPAKQLDKNSPFSRRVPKELLRPDLYPEFRRPHFEEEDCWSTTVVGSALLWNLILAAEAVFLAGADFSPWRDSALGRELGQGESVSRIGVLDVFWAKGQSQTISVGPPDGNQLALRGIQSNQPCFSRSQRRNSICSERD